MITTEAILALLDVCQDNEEISCLINIVDHAFVVGAYKPNNEDFGKISRKVAQVKK
jgi:hypothetical protein